MTTRAVRVHEYGGPEVLKVDNIPIPQPKDNEVLIKVYSAGVNPVDTHIRDRNLFSLKLPFICGGDAAGVVEEVGSEVTEYKKGDRVYTIANFSGGGYAEYTVAASRLVAPLDDKLSYAQGASIGIPYWTAHKALYNRAQAKPGDTVLVHGASGAVGVATVQIAKANGQRVIGTAGTKEGLELVKKLGADLVFNHREKDYTEKILESTGGKGVNVIVEMLANVNLDKDLDLLAFRGRVVIVGCRGDILISPRKTMMKESSIMGIVLMNIENEKEWTEIRAALDAGQKIGWLNPVVAKEYKLSDAGQAQRDVMVNSGTFGKLVIDTTK